MEANYSRKKKHRKKGQVQMETCIGSHYKPLIVSNLIQFSTIDQFKVYIQLDIIAWNRCRTFKPAATLDWFYVIWPNLCSNHQKIHTITWWKEVSWTPSTLLNIRFMFGVPKYLSLLWDNMNLINNLPKSGGKWLAASQSNNNSKNKTKKNMWLVWVYCPVRTVLPPHFTTILAAAAAVIGHCLLSFH